MNPEDLAAALLAVVDPARRGATRGIDGRADGGGAAAGPAEEPRSRRLGLQRRAQAREGGRREPARARRRDRGRSRRGRPASRASRSPDPASSTSDWMPRPPALSPRRSSRPAPPSARTSRQRGNTINVEFVSANPTGPLHIGHTRWAALGDSIARLLLGQRRDGRPRVLHQRRRRPDGAVRSLGARRGQGRADTRGRLRRVVHRRARAPRARSAARPARAGCR